MFDGATVGAPADVLVEERAVLLAAERALDHMKRAAASVADYGVDALASESLGRIRAERLAALAADPGVPAFFGRIDTSTPDRTVASSNGAGEVFHVGRRHVRDEDGDPLVIDWRAPMAAAFYRASPTAPMGVHRRRRFGFADRELTSYEDELLDDATVVTDAGVSDLLRREIERPRSGPMRDIAATISPDQDDLVRASLDTSLCVQGAPGTGKTAVGLHRAAFLLFTHPERLSRSGVLVVGPNSAFLQYIEAVLPTLGESGVRQATVDDLVGFTPGPRTPVDPVGLAVLKGDLRWAAALQRAVLRQVAKPVDDVVVTGGSLGSRRYRVPVERLRRYVDDARREVAAGALRWSVARARLASQVAEDVRRQREDVGGAPSDRETAALARRPGVTEFLAAVWPVLTPADLLGRLYSDGAFRRRCAPHLDDHEHALLQRPPSTSRRTAWTVADAPLLDELRWLLDGGDTVGHVVVDEAQDLSPMQCRALARRCPTGSFTVLGDLAQATTPWAPGSWAPTLAALGRPDAVLRPLTVGYRVPGAVLEVTNRLLPVIAAELAPASSLRAAPDALHWSTTARLVDEVRAALDHEGTVGVIAADAALPGVATVLAAVSAHAGDRLVLVAATAAKGLEFDTAVVVDPAAVVAAEPTRVVGLRRLYVVLTRAVSRLVVCEGAESVVELGR